MKKTKKNKTKELSTFEREMQNAKFKAAFEQEYEAFALQTRFWQRCRKGMKSLCLL